MLRKLFSHSSADETYRNQGQAANREDQSTAGESTAPFAWRDGPRDPHGCAQHEDSKFAAQTFRHAPRLDRSVGHTFSAVGLNSDCKLWRESLATHGSTAIRARTCLWVQAVVASECDRLPVPGRGTPMMCVSPLAGLPAAVMVADPG